jgi:hypothetical protein
MKNKETNYEDLIKKINSLQASLMNLKNQLKSVYTICDTCFGPKKDDDSKDTKND